MLKHKGRELVRWFILLPFFWTVAFATLQCCGMVTQSKGEALNVSLELPAGDDPEQFWEGVDKKILRLSPTKAETVEVAWEPGKKTDIDLREGDKIVFLGFDLASRLVVTGEGIVTAEKKVTIPLRRVL